MFKFREFDNYTAEENDWKTNKLQRTKETKTRIYVLD